MLDARCVRFALVVLAGAGFAAAGLAAAAVPLGRPFAASPGDPVAAAPIGGICPTFSWSAVAGADGYRLVIVETDAGGAPVAVALSRRLDGGALGSFTPALGECLAAGHSYSWSIGALAPGADSVADPDWSEPRRFEIAMAPSDQEIAAALDVLSRARGALPASVSTAESSSAARTHGSRAPRTGATPDSAPAVAAIRGEGAGIGAAGMVGVASATSGLGHGVYGETLSADYQAAGVLGRAWTYGGDGVRGESTGTDGGNGLHGTAAGTWGRGVFGEAAGTSGTGVEGRFSASSGSGRGVYGVSAATGGYGAVNGYATPTTGSNPGVRGDANSPSSAGVVGVSSPAGYGLGGGIGVWGEVNSTTGRGVFGRNTSTTGGTVGVLGEVSSPQGVAVYGLSNATSGTSYAVYGTVSTTTAFAGYFAGKVHVSGTLSKGGGSFKIDHPLDPEHRYLYHSFVESPDMMNVYNGNVTLDDDGSAWIELPDWFEALNRDFRYQLTPIGQPSAVWIGHEIADHRFEIRGGPGVRVSWQVAGIRHDKWAEANRIPVEETKPADEQGTYLHPAAWGVPAARGLDARRARSLPELAPVALSKEVPDAPR